MRSTCWPPAARSSGSVAAPLGARDGRVALYRRSNTRKLLEPPVPLEVSDDVHDALLAHLEHRGASFLSELADAARAAREGLSMEDFKAALWDLVWAGLVTNDTFAPLRAAGRPVRRRARTEPLAGGRWSLVRQLVPGNANATLTAVARAKMLLNRYGIVSREVASAETLPGGFGSIYKVLREMEETGKLRRGYFIEGLSGAQFASAGAIDRLRACRADSDERDLAVNPDEIQLLCAMDPANPYGSLLPWPDTGDPQGQAKPRRVAGAWVLLARGRPLLYVGRRGRSLLTFPENLRRHDEALPSALEALRRLPKDGRRGLLVIQTIDNCPASESALLSSFRDAGFRPDYRGLVDVQAPTAGRAQGA
jgi:ATP-dependent Lhr-like helicase